MYLLSGISAPGDDGDTADLEDCEVGVSIPSPLQFHCILIENTYTSYRLSLLSNLVVFSRRSGCEVSFPKMNACVRQNLSELRKTLIGLLHVISLLIYPCSQARPPLPRFFSSIQSQSFQIVSVLNTQSYSSFDRLVLVGNRTVRSHERLCHCSNKSSHY